MFDRAYFHHNVFGAVRVGNVDVLTVDRTPVAIYSDSARTTLATCYADAIGTSTTVTNPLTPDTSSEVSCWLPAGQMYYLTIGDETGVFFAAGDTFDAISVDGDILNTLSHTTPEAHGCVGDGVTNDTATFQLALNDKPWLVLTPGKTYLVNEITIPDTLRRLTMYGATVKHAAVGDGLGMFSTTAGLGPLLVEGGEVIGIDDDAIAIGDSAFYIDPTTETIGTHHDITFRDVIFKNLQGYGIFVGYCRTLHVEDCRFDSCTLGINAFTLRSAWIVGCDFDGSPYTGTSKGVMCAINLTPDPTDFTSDNQNRLIHVSGNSFRNQNLHQALLLHGAMNGEVTRNLFEQCSNPIGYHMDTLNDFEGHWNLVISNNVATGTDDYGSSTTGSLQSGVVDRFLDIAGETGNPAINVLVENNIIRHFGYAAEADTAGSSANTGAITLNGAATRVEIRNNLLDDITGNGIYAACPLTTVRIRANTFRTIVSPSGGDGHGITFVNDGTNPTVTGTIEANIFDTMAVGLITATGVTATALYVMDDNQFRGVTSPILRAANADFPSSFLVLTTGTTITPDVRAAGHTTLRLEITGAFTLALPVNATPGKILTLEIYNNGSLGTITWDSGYHKSSFTNPVGGATHLRTFYCRTATQWREIAAVATLV